jgi:K+-transporting ATPase KdpF subunit
VPGIGKEILVRKETVMNLAYLITGLFAVGLFVYLVFALLKPEMFE